MSNFHKLRVKSIERETPEAVSVGFEVPAELKSKFSYTAGQYLTLEKEISGTKFRRSFSICSSPESGELKVAVKQIADGRFSSWVNQKLKEGDFLNVFLPEGRFVFEPSEKNQAKTFVAFAAGSGITPVMAILQSVLLANSKNKFILIYGNKTPEQTIFSKDLEKLKERYPNRLFIEYTYSQLKKEKSPLKAVKNIFSKKKIEEKPENVHYKRIDENLVEYIIKEKFKTEDFSDFYLCGPEEMINMTSEVLKANKIPEHNIHFELFVTTENNSEASSTENREGKTTLTIILDEEETTLEIDRNTKVLDAAMEADLDPPYSCRGGICSSCIAQITEGDVEMVNNQILTKGEVESGLTLTCQALPKTDRLIVDYDDI